MLALVTFGAATAIVGAMYFDGWRQDRTLEAGVWLTGPPVEGTFPPGPEFPVPARYLPRGGIERPGGRVSSGFAFSKEAAGEWLDDFQRFLESSGCTVERASFRRYWLRTREVRGESDELDWTASVETSLFRQIADAQVTWERKE